MPRKTISSQQQKTSKKRPQKAGEARVLHRLHCAQLVLGGMLVKDVAKRSGDSPRAVAYWVEKFKAGGVANLANKKRSGRPPLLDASQMKTIRSFVRKERKANKPVNARVLAAYIKQSFDINVSTRQCWRILEEIV